MKIWQHEIFPLPDLATFKKPTNRLLFVSEQIFEDVHDIYPKAIRLPNRETMNVIVLI